MEENQESYVVDTSVIIERAISKLIKKKEIKGRIIVPHAIVAELEHQANLGLEIGFLGIEELQELRKLADEKQIEIAFVGSRPISSQIKYAKLGEIDAVIREIAYNEQATLITADKVQSESAKIFGIKVLFIEAKKPKEKLEIEKFFDEHTMSVHLKEGCFPYGKKGKPGEWELIKISEEKIPTEKVQEMAKEIVEKSRIDPKSFVEISRRGSTIVQYRNYRIVITKPPVSNGWEITAVRPLKKLNIDDYKLSEELFSRIKEKSRGIIIAGEPGSGKCLPKGTKVYLKNNLIKNIEDIKVGDEVLTYDKNCRIVHNKVKRCFNRISNKIIIIKTNFGKEMELTPEHPIFSFKEGIPTWIEAKDLTISSRIATARKIDNEGNLQKIDWIDMLPEDRILVKIKEDTNRSIPIEKTLLGLKRKIVTIIKQKRKCKLADINKELRSDSGWIRVLLLELVKERILNRKNKPKHFTYYLDKNETIIKKGDIIPLKTLKEHFKKENIYDLTDEISKFDTWHKSTFIKPPRYLTKELCELLGYYIGESLTKYGISTDSKFCRERFIDLSKKIFNIDVDKTIKEYGVYTDRYGSIELFLNRCLGISLLKSKKRATYHKIPELILRSPKIEIASFLRAYFDTECYISPKKGIEISSASIDLIKNTQLALLNFNIQSSIRQKIINNKSYYLLYVYGYNNIKRFKEEIGLIEKVKQLGSYLKINKAGSPNKDTIPLRFLLQKIKERELSNIIKSSMVRKRDYSHERAQSTIKLISPHIKETLSLIELAMIEVISSDYIQWDKVISIKKENGERKVYDIEIENTHNFLAGEVPFIVHNSTFAQALAEFYSSKGRITKTVESPRDLQVSENITQYSKNFATSEEIHDILFLSRPDNIIFDEMRDTPDFQLYTDLRLAGSECIGVLHSASPIDAIQRFIPRLELGMIPSVIDTILFIEKGKISKIYSLKMVVKVPTGMTEADLSRPIVEVRDFETKKLEYEVYSYGEQTVVIPVESEAKSSSIKQLAIKQITEEFKKYSKEVEVELLSDNKAVVYVPENNIARIIGTKGENINQIEKRLNISIDVKEIEKEKAKTEFTIGEDKKYIKFYTQPGMDVDIFIDNNYIFTAIASKRGEIRINKNSKLGRDLLKAVSSRKNIELRA